MNMTKVLRMVSALLLSSGCGRMEPSDTPAESSEDVQEAAPTEQEAETPQEVGPEEQAAKEIELNLTAEYAKRAVDILVMRDNSNRISSNNNPFATRLYVDDGNTPRGFQEFAVRLYFSEMNFQLGFMDVIFNDDADADAKAGDLIQGAPGEDVKLRISANNFIDTVIARSAIAPGAAVSDSIQRNNANFHYPLRALRELVVDRSDSTGGPSARFLRNNALLSIVYVGYLDEIKESIDTQDIIDALDASRGPGNWVVSALAPPAEGCEFTDGNGDTWHTNGDQFAANSTDPDVIAKYQRRNKMLKLQEYSGGIFESICAESYIDFFSKVVTEGTLNAFFPIEVEVPADPETLSITVSGVEVEGWRYNTQTHTIMVPTSVKPGTDMKVTYTASAEYSGDFVDETEVETDETIPDIEGQELSPAEIAFLTGGIRDILQSNGCIGCHNQYGSFDSTWSDRNNILNRITLPDADPLNMPQNPDAMTVVGFDTQANKDALIAWLTGN